MIDLNNLKKHFKDTLILNPTENIPFVKDNKFDFLEGLYVGGEIPNENSKIAFGGRNDYICALNFLQEKWAELLKAKEVNLRALSGLHAHIVMLMSLGNIGDKILLLAEEAGGHYSSKMILERLGFQVILTIQDNNSHRVDAKSTIDLIRCEKPEYALIDRSEGLYYEDFSWLNKTSIPCLIFDASQYLTQIITGEYKHPFNMGFDLIVSTLHKNYPGPQKAILATKETDNYWNKMKRGCNVYISNAHPLELFKSVQILENESLKEYSGIMLSTSARLETALLENGLPVVKKNTQYTPTQHIWIRIPNKEKCFQIFKNLETSGFLVNYRLLPYNLGYGLRLGTGGAVRSGLRENHIGELASLITNIYYNGVSPNMTLKCKEFISKIKK